MSAVQFRPWTLELAEILGTRVTLPPMKIVVDFDLCVSNARCVRACPEVFEVREDGFLYILNEDPPETIRGKLEQAVSDCPTHAITLEG